MEVGAEARAAMAQESRSVAMVDSGASCEAALEPDGPRLPMTAKSSPYVRPMLQGWGADPRRVFFIAANIQALEAPFELVRRLVVASRSALGLRLMRAQLMKGDPGRRPPKADPVHCNLHDRHPATGIVKRHS